MAKGRAWVVVDSGPDISLSPRINLGNGLHPLLPPFLVPWLLAIWGWAQHISTNSMNAFKKVLLNETPTQTNGLTVWDQCVCVWGGVQGGGEGGREGS